MDATSVILSETPDRDQERETLLTLLDQLSQSFPDRRSASDGERGAQLLIQAALADLGLATEVQPFVFSTSQHANLALHFGLGTLGTLVGGFLPPLGVALHAASTASYVAESSQRWYLLRRLLPRRPSQNVVATLPARGGLRRRVVFLAHADAGFTGWLHHPYLKRIAASGQLPAYLSFLERPVAAAAQAQATLMAMGAARTVLGPLGIPFRPVDYPLGLPSLAVFLMNLQALIHDRVVPGANDNLSGLVTLPVLARRLRQDRPAGLEVVLVATGCEEAGFGGADALAERTKGVWTPEETTVVAIDSVGLGEPRYTVAEGEVIRRDVPDHLVERLRFLAQRDLRFGAVRGLEVPAGGTDAGPFLARGFDACTLTRVDPLTGAPPHYHLPADTVDRLDLERILATVDLAEALAREIAS